jgi:hypothetical protein
MQFASLGPEYGTARSSRIEACQCEGDMMAGADKINMW